MSQPRTATVVVTTKNRKDELRTCLQSVIAQSAAPEVLVMDDASSDGTAAMVRAEFPGVRLVLHDRSEGYIRRRNQAARLAHGDVIVSLDDDAVFSAAGIIAQTMADFDGERIGAVAMPYIDVNRDARVNQVAPDARETYVTGTFIGTAHAVRREVFLALGGYREPLFHQGEESDFCIRLIAAGYFVRLGSAAPIHHFESPRRDFRRMDHFGPRNAILFAWQNVPMPQLLLHWPATAARVLGHTWQPQRLAARAAGLAAGFVECFRQERSPVSPAAYRLMRRLRTHQPPLMLRDVTGG